MTSSATDPNPAKTAYLTQLYLINRLLIKAGDAATVDVLTFIILNDTLHLIPYNRALLFSFEGATPQAIGISGQDKVNPNSQLLQKWCTLIKELQNPEKEQILKIDSFKGHEQLFHELQDRVRSSVLWLPIFIKNKLAMGMWIEKWDANAEDFTNPEKIALLKNFLMPGYGVAWSKFTSHYSVIKRTGVTKHLFLYGVLGLFLSTLVVRLPLRVVAPCEVVPKTPYLITAPVDGIVDVITVKPSQAVKKGDVLFVYNKKDPEQNLKLSESQVDVLQADVNRAMTQGLSDSDPLTQMPVLKIKMEKEKINRDYQRYINSMLDVKAPAAGIVIMDAPDDWRGRPVSTGDKVMMISNPSEIKVKMWVPESSKVIINPDKPIAIILTSYPVRTYHAKITSIANQSVLSPSNVPSVVVDADWNGPLPPEVKLGLKGTAILYGENVTLFYYIIYRPLEAVRKFLSV